MKSFRQNKLLDILQKDKIIKTKVMADYFGVSIETIRRDLDQLESEGIINKIYGGAELRPQAEVAPSPLVARRGSMQPVKAAIAAKTAEYIPNRCTIALDAGSTIYELCPYLNQKEDLVIICSDVHTATRLLENTNNKVYLMGGFLTSDGTSKGTFSDSFFDNISRIDIFVCATDGAIPDEGLTCDAAGINDLKKKYMRTAGKRIAVLDHTKFTHSGFYKTCDFNDLDIMITDSGAPEDALKTIKKSGIQIETVEYK